MLVKRVLGNSRPANASDGASTCTACCYDRDPAADDTVSVVALVRRRGFRDLLVGQGVSSLGDWMGTVAFMALVLELTDSPIAVGGILTLRLLPAALGGPLAARAALRWDRRRTMLAMDATRAVIDRGGPVRPRDVVGVPVGLPHRGREPRLPAGARLVDPRPRASDDELPLANGLILGSSYGSIPIGAALFAAVAALPFEIVRPAVRARVLDRRADVPRLVLLHRAPHAAGPTPHAAADDVEAKPASSTRSASRWCAR